MLQANVGLRQAIEAHFAEVDRVGIRNGKSSIVVTTIYVDNVKAFSIKSTKSKIGECKICDPRIKAVLNSHPVGYMFLNSKYSCVFGDSASVVINTLHELCVTAILDFNENRVRFKNASNTWGRKLLLIETVVAVVVSFACLMGVIYRCSQNDAWGFTFHFIPVLLAFLLSLKQRPSNLVSIISFAVALLNEIIMLVGFLR